jgi:membrane fusion protein, multidrug efflux system
MKRLTHHTLIFVWILAYLAVCLTACQNRSQSQSDNGQNADKVLSALKVKTASVELRDFEPIIQGTGTLRPHRHASLKALVGGAISQLPVDIGTQVKKGSLLFEIRPVDYELALQQAQANVDQANVVMKDREREMKRMQNLFSEGFATEQMRDQALTGHEQSVAAVKQTKAARDTARQMLRDCRIVAQYDGVITTRFMEQGEFVGVGDPVVEIMDLTVLNAEVDVPEKYAGKIFTGNIVQVHINSHPNPYKGTVIAVNPKINSDSRTFLVKISVDNTDQLLQAGLFCTMAFALPVEHNKMAIPRVAVQRDEGRSFVWIVEDGKAWSRVVEEGPYLNGFILIRDGLMETDHVVTDGYGALHDGMNVIME